MRRMRTLALALLVAGCGPAAGEDRRTEVRHPDGTVDIPDPTDGGWYTRVPPHLAEAVRCRIVDKQAKADTLPRIAPTHIPDPPAWPPLVLPPGACPGGR